MKTKAMQTSVETRWTIIALHSQGLSASEVARKLGVSDTTVRSWVKRHRSTASVASKPRPGRPRLTNSLQDRVIVEAIRADPYITAKQIKEQYQLPCSINTIRNRMHSLRKDELNFDVPPMQGIPSGQILKEALWGASVKRKIGKDRGTRSSNSFSMCGVEEAEQDQHMAASHNSLISRGGNENSYMKKKCTSERRPEWLAVDVKHEARDEVKLEVKEEALEEEKDTSDLYTRVQGIHRCSLENGWAQSSIEDDSDNFTGTEPAILPLPLPAEHSGSYSDTGRAILPLPPPEDHTLRQEGLYITEAGSAILSLPPSEHHPIMHRRVNLRGAKLGIIPLAPQDPLLQERVNLGDTEPAILPLAPPQDPLLQERVNLGDTGPEIIPLAPGDLLAEEGLNLSDAKPEILTLEDPLAQKSVNLSNMEPALLSVTTCNDDPLMQERVASAASNQHVLGTPSHQGSLVQGSDPLETGCTSPTTVMSDTDDTSNSTVVLGSEEDRVSLSSDSDEIKECEEIGHEENEKCFMNATLLDSDSSSIDTEDDDMTFHNDVPKTDKIKEVPWIWKSGDFLPNLFFFNFSNSQATATGKITKSSTELDIFLYFFDAGLMDLITWETNKQYKYLTRPSLQYLDGWWDVTTSELYVFLGLCMLRPHIGDGSSRQFWTAVQEMYSSSHPKFMTEARFNMIAKMLHFSSNYIHTKDPLAKIRPVLSRLQKKFKAGIIPSRNLTIDESQILFSSRLNCKLSIPSKNHDYEVKTYVLCDCKTGFVTDFLIYSSVAMGFCKDYHGTAGAIVKRLLAPLYGKGHTVFMGDWCSNPKLFHYLYTKKVGACGVVKPDLKYCPKFDDITRRKSVAYHANNVLALKWQEQESVYLLSTVHEWQAASKSKPLAIVNHRNNTRIFGIADIQTHTGEIGVFKWYKELFFHLLDLAVLNTYALIAMKTGTKSKYRVFHQRLTKQILEKFMNETKEPKGCSANSEAEKVSIPLRFRLSKGHFIRIRIDRENKEVQRTQYCVVCLKTRSQKQKEKGTNYYCSVCNVPLCVIPCFERYHTVKNF
ncbi:uncharacterized protein LOC135092107 isoform X1 [Scylla paramamosain]|uniref:uncharacterized protein LOC135092107 isoform X1 n=1 Tax=Scylla paramamosain TaxID=85552 RepID=UPI003083036E